MIALVAFALGLFMGRASVDEPARSRPAPKLPPFNPALCGHTPKCNVR